MTDHRVTHETNPGAGADSGARTSETNSDAPLFELLPDFSRTAKIEEQRAAQSRLLPASLIARLSALANLHGATASGVCVAAWATELFRYSGETCLVLQIAGQKKSVSLTGDPDFCELLRGLQAIPSSLRIAQSGMTLAFDECADGLLLTCEFDQQLYQPATIDRLLEHFELLLRDALQNPHAPVSELSFLSTGERERLLVEWNATWVKYPRDVSIDQLFERTVKQTPDAIALSMGEETLTYAALGARASHIAKHLRQRGVRPGLVIGILLDRSFDMVASLLAVLQTGAAYLPLDPSFPAARLEFMAADAEIRLLITTANLANKVTTKPQTILIDQDELTLESSPVQETPSTVDAGSIAYVLYTSGSTGKPKGVQIEHRSVVNLLCSIQSHVELKPGDSLLAVTTLSFDIAGLELLLPLMTGSRVVLASQSEASDPVALRELLTRTKPTLMQATPSTWRMLIDAGWGGSADLKILVGGEKVTREVADALIERGSAVWNCYGPTETTIWSTICRIERNGQPVSIGRPLANTALYVLDARRRLLPQGAAGELYIGGDGVARSYLKRPELTAERFVPNPFGAGRLYRTGDIVRYQEDGRLEILGRNDAQVKVRGFRIEIGDIEEALTACPQIRAAAVVIRTAKSGESVLAGYFVADATDGAKVRQWLSSRLPEYMVPTFLVPLKALPLTANGKVDRSALSLPDTTTLPEPEAAVDRLEATLLGIWESVLGVQPIGRTQNFFDLGGHSVLAAKAFARMEKTLGTALPLATLFQAPTVEKLAQVIRNSKWKPLWSSLVAIRPAGAKPPFFFVHPIGGNVLNFVGFCGHFGPDRPIYGLQARGLNGEEEPHTLIKEMATDYLRSIRSVQPEGPYFIGGFSAGGVVAFEMAHQLRAAGQEVATLALLDTEVLTLHLAEGSMAARARHWVRTVKINFRYASRVSVAEFLRRKSTNFRMRRKLLVWGLREQLGLEIQPARLTAEEGFLLAMRRYVPCPYPGDATLFRAGDGSDYPDPKLGWDGLIEGNLDIQQVSGDHDTILQEPHIGMLARLLEGCLENAPRQEPPKASSAPSSERIARLRPAIDIGKP